MQTIKEPVSNKLKSILFCLSLVSISSFVSLSIPLPLLLSLLSRCGAYVDEHAYHGTWVIRRQHGVSLGVRLI